MTIIIYLIGCILLAILHIKYLLKENDYTIGHLPITFVFMFTSWIGIIALYLYQVNSDIIIFKKKKK